MNKQVNALAQQIEKEVMNSNNYKNFASEYYDAPEQESALDYTDTPVLNMDTKKNVIGLSSYSVNVLYVNGGGGLPVQVELFGTNFNTGVIVGTTLTFTNGVDSAVVSGITSPITAFQDRLRSAPFKVAYFRESVVGAAQLQQQFTFRKDSVYGGFGGNTLDPDEFITPEQFQLLRVDVPVNSFFDTERRLIFNSVSSETAPGTKITFYVNGLLNPSRALNGLDQDIKMQGNGLLQSTPTESTRAELNKVAQMQAATTKMIQQLVVSKR